MKDEPRYVWIVHYRGVKLVLRTETELSIIGGTWPI